MTRPTLSLLAGVLCFVWSVQASSAQNSLLTGGYDKDGHYQDHEALVYEPPPYLVNAARSAMVDWIAENPTRPMPIVCLGNSIYMTVCQRLRELLNRITPANGGFEGLHRPNVEIIRCAKGGHTAPQWADPLEPGWNECDGKVIAFGATTDDVPFGIIGLTTGFPVTSGGVMSRELVQQIAVNFRTHYARAFMLLTSTMNWTGRSGHAGNPRAPNYSVAGDQDTLADESKIQPNGLITFYRPVYASGNIPEPNTCRDVAPPLSCTPLTYNPEDLADDQLHIKTAPSDGSRIGSDKPARSILSWMRRDPMFFGMWIDGQPPIIVPPIDPILQQLFDAWRRKNWDGTCDLLPMGLAGPVIPVPQALRAPVCGGL